MESTQFPHFCTQPAAEPTLLALHDCVLIAYERERDFMSAPKAFVIIEAPIDAPITLNACHANEAQWLVLEQEPYGVYQYQYDDSHFFAFYGKNQLIDVQADELVRHEEVYHCANSYQAILKYLAQHEELSHGAGKEPQERD